MDWTTGLTRFHQKHGFRDSKLRHEERLDITSSLIVVLLLAPPINHAYYLLLVLLRMLIPGQNSKMRRGVL